LILGPSSKRSWNSKSALATTLFSLHMFHDLYMYFNPMIAIYDLEYL
jgi:hypothetical protein